MILHSLQDRCVHEYPLSRSVKPMQGASKYIQHIANSVSSFICTEVTQGAAVSRDTQLHSK